MSRRLKQLGVVFIVVLAAAQLIRPERTNPATDLGRSIQAFVGTESGTTSGLVAILDRSCRDCHSNRTVWPGNTQIAPLSWLMVYAVREGRRAVNFSDWSAYSTEQRRMLLAQSCADVTAGKMPDGYTRLHPETRLSSQDIDTICAAARQADASEVHGP